MEKSIYDNEYKVLIQLLYNMRISCGLKQSELASLISEPQSFISKIENGERRLDIIELKRICEVLEIKLTEFVSEFEKRLSEGKS